MSHVVIGKNRNTMNRFITPADQGIQHCSTCDAKTNHIPKLDLVLVGKRLCEVCRTSNDYEPDYKAWWDELSETGELLKFVEDKFDSYKERGFDVQAFRSSTHISKDGETLVSNKLSYHELKTIYQMETEHPEKQEMSRPISEAPERWVIVEIAGSEETYYKVFGSWAGGYLGSDRWKLNSGIVRIEEDDDNYYFYGFSGSCYQCHKKGYGFMTSYGQGVLENFIERAVEVDTTMTIVDEDTDWMVLFA